MGMEHLLDKRGKGRLIYRLADLDSVKPTAVIAMDTETHGGSNADIGNPSYAGMGLSGLSLCTLDGESVYVVIDDGRNYGGVPVKELIAYLNERWMLPGRLVVFWNSKYDLGFLVVRGLDVSKVRLIDGWVLNSMKNECAFSSNKLKDIMRERFKIETDSETVIKNWLKEHKTENYGDLPVELVGPYACDDVLYTMVAYFDLVQKGISIVEWAVHDRMVRNNLNLNAAEARGIVLDRVLLKDRLELTVKKIQESAKFIKESLGAMEVDVYDQNAMMTVLHSKNLHSEPKDWYGEKKYVLDDEFMLGTKSELAKEYCWFARRQNFLKYFSGQKERGGIMGTRIWLRENTAGFHLSHFPSMHSKGGMPQVRTPDFDQGIKLSNEIREMFIPRPGHSFLTIRLHDLPTLLLAYYTKDTDLLTAVQRGEKNLALYLVNRDSPDIQDKELWAQAVSLWLLKEFQGSGDGLLERRLHGLGIKIRGYNVHGIRDKVSKMLRPKDGAATYAQFKKALEETFAKQSLLDRGNRSIRPEEKKRWRGFAILLQSSMGGIITTYLDTLCRVAAKTNAYLVLSHEDEMIFEVSENNPNFETVAAQLAVTQIIEPKPRISLQKQSAWRAEGLDAHLAAYRRLVP
jgi:hypothetical protein